MPTIAEITTHALSLPVKSRALLADVLLDSLAEVEIKNYDQIWLDEAKKEIKKYPTIKFNASLTRKS